MWNLIHLRCQTQVYVFHWNRQTSILHGGPWIIQSKRNQHISYSWDLQAGYRLNQKATHFATISGLFQHLHCDRVMLHGVVYMQPQMPQALPVWDGPGLRIAKTSKPTCIHLQSSKCQFSLCLIFPKTLVPRPSENRSQPVCLSLSQLC